MVDYPFMSEPQHPRCHGPYPRRPSVASAVNLNVVGFGAAVGVLLLATASCAVKERDFGEDDTAEEAGATIVEQGDGRSEPDDSIGPAEGAGQPASTAPDSNSGRSSAPRDRGGSEPADACGDSCSSACTPGATRCASATQRVECGMDALWANPIECPYVCFDGACGGECVPGALECVSSIRFRSCSEFGLWSEPSDCENACVGAECGGDCRPGETRCSTGTTVQTCDDEGQWGDAAACQNACVGEACAGECSPGNTRCASETQLQVCGDQGQFEASLNCPFACVNGSCGGECSPGARRCDPTTGVPQFCTNIGTWQAQARCEFVCIGSGSCTGECTPGAGRCIPSSPVPQLCTQAGSWQSQNSCLVGQECQGGACVASAPPATLATQVAPAAIPLTVVGAVAAPVRWTVINTGGQPTQALQLDRTTFDRTEFSIESSCLGVALAPGSTCLLNITFTPQRPAGIRNPTFRVTAGALSASTALPAIQVRIGLGGACTLGAVGECQPGLGCQQWYLDQDQDGWGGEERFGGAPPKATCSNEAGMGRPADEVAVGPGAGGFPFELAMPYVAIAGDCCDLAFDVQGSDISVRASDVNPGVTEPDDRPATRCANPDDLDCDGVAECTRIPARDGTLCI